MVNPWLIVGGVATAVCTQNEIIIPENAIVGDVLVLTKPLGTQVRLDDISLCVQSRLIDCRLLSTHINGWKIPIDGIVSSR